jgi:hypothetical protein
MRWLRNFKSLWLILVALFFAVPTWAQFEVSPDHFDSVANTPTSRKPKARSADVAHITSSPVTGATRVAAKVPGRQTIASNHQPTKPLNPESHAVYTVARTGLASKTAPVSRAAKATPSMTQRE